MYANLLDVMSQQLPLLASGELDAKGFLPDADGRCSEEPVNCLPQGPVKNGSLFLLNKKGNRFYET